MIETLLGGLLGGVFRIVPEVLKWMDSENERKHELDMQDKQLEFQKLAGTQKMDEIVGQGQVDWNVGALDTLKSAIASQASPSGIKWIDGLSSSVRPVITYWFMALFCSVKVALFFSYIDLDITWMEAVRTLWGESDMALFAGIMNFWFLGRVFDKALK